MRSIADTSSSRFVHSSLLLALDNLKRYLAGGCLVPSSLDVLLPASPWAFACVCVASVSSDWRGLPFCSWTSALWTSPSLTTLTSSPRRRRRRARARRSSLARCVVLPLLLCVPIGDNHMDRLCPLRNFRNWLISALGGMSGNQRHLHVCWKGPLWSPCWPVPRGPGRPRTYLAVQAGLPCSRMAACAPTVVERSLEPLRTVLTPAICASKVDSLGCQTPNAGGWMLRRRTVLQGLAHLTYAATQPCD